MSATSARDILFVDDVHQEAEFYGEYLSNLPEIQVTTAVSAEEALEILKNSDVDCLVSDSVQTADGVPLVEVAKRTYQNLPVVLYSGRSPTELPTEVVDAYLPKGGRAGANDSVDKLGDLVRELTDQTARSSLSGNGHSSAGWKDLGRFNWTDKSPSIQLIEALSKKTDFNPFATTPLYETINPDALDELLSHAVASENDSNVVVDMQFAGIQLRVASDGSAEYREGNDSEPPHIGNADY